MTSNKKNSTEENTQFVLKHRITGAAFLIFFGVLFLPWLLGAPSEARKIQIDTVEQNIDSVSSAEIEQELVAELENEDLTEEVEVYVSRITPLDAASENLESDDRQDISQSQVIQTPKATEKVAITTQPAEEKKEIEDVPKIVTSNDNKVVARPEQTITDIKPVKSLNSVKVGWVVQVGVFTDKEGARNVVADLKSKGFIPSATIVDTNKGKGTGTRVWLGPYAQRVDAAKSMTELKQKTGGAGFIRAYP